MSHKKKPEDSHKVRDDKKEKARKEHEVAANVVETIVIGEAGNERDRIANLVPTMKAIKEVADFLHDIVEIDAKIAEKVVEAVSEEVAESIPAVLSVETSVEDDTVHIDRATLEIDVTPEEALPDTGEKDEYPVKDAEYEGTPAIEPLPDTAVTDHEEVAPDPDIQRNREKAAKLAKIAQLQKELEDLDQA
ncbi:MAG: hypothetical protein ACYTBJ_06220 [Planctomycetota bacterium]|jgi:hypothetical protein